jgi:SpoVK/Ycf46/Vps4 family AAA+-type ATPase
VSWFGVVLCAAGEASHKHMVVVVSNRPADIDRAVLDRMDIIIEVSRPDP